MTVSNNKLKTSLIMLIDNTKNWLYGFLIPTIHLNYNTRESVCVCVCMRVCAHLIAIIHLNYNTTTQGEVSERVCACLCSSESMIVQSTACSTLDSTIS